MQYGKTYYTDVYSCACTLFMYVYIVQVLFTIYDHQSNASMVLALPVVMHSS